MPAVSIRDAVDAAVDELALDRLGARLRQVQVGLLRADVVACGSRPGSSPTGAPSAASAISSIVFIDSGVGIADPNAKFSGDGENACGVVSPVPDR